MASGDAMLHGVYGGCISIEDMGLQQRPYHSNCSCALHKSNSGQASHCSHMVKVSYPMRRSWSEGSMLAMKSMAQSPGSSPSCSSLSNTMATPSTIKDSSLLPQV
uniref:uncharacterized protein LOC122601015 n=1 Tax=Erigeron canadensis TaxID=72917 RepID=UPI001CB97FA5|nr:uncharacterized protein LOC122601015 [Erigeron canadensis]